MASIKVKFRPSVAPEREGTIFYQIIHERTVRQLTSDNHVLAEEWDGRRRAVTVSPRSERKALIASVRERIRRDVERLTRVIRRLEGEGLTFTADDVVSEFNRYACDFTLFNFMENTISSLRQNGKIRTAETYRATLNSFRKFRGGEDIMLDALTSDTMKAYEAWHHRRGVVPNTASFYLRILRAVYNRAVELGAIDNLSPFRHVYTGVDKTVKRALPIPTIRRIRALDLSACRALDFARDMFLLSFYLRGMSFVDMAFLRKTDLRGGYVTYRRRKTRQLLVIAWTREMQAILDKYPENDSQYLLPIIRTHADNERCVYRNAAYNINHNLKKIALMLGIPIPLTLYVARHSWASAASAKGVPLRVISEGMGHDSETTTRIYLASLDASAVDRANSLILRSL